VSGEPRSTEGELIARVLHGPDPPPAVVGVATRVAGIPQWQRRQLGVDGLVKAYGVESRKAARIAALWELAERWYPDDRPAITAPRDALLLLEPLRCSRREQVVTLLLDARHRLVSAETVAVGTVNASRLQPRDVFGPALRADAVAVIIGHNHPSGDPAPSRADRVVTAALRSAAELLGIQLLDHIIVARGSHHSFRECEGWDEAG
jgi:DNA repair protein RadC